jgi:hydroxymethylbilane synthase
LIRIGTRGSALALAQARWVAERITGETTLVTITTAGDRGETRDDKSEWVSELEQALLDERVDVAVHSAKDVPAELADGLAIVAIPARADARDAICGAPSLAALPAGARVGTSSLRRQAQLRAAREDLDVVEIRGNVDTRLRKLQGGEYDALVLAVAGLERLGRVSEAGGVLDELVPAAGQGALAIEARKGWPAGEGRQSESLEALRNWDARRCVLAERQLTRRLGASCNSAVGANARPTGDGNIELRAWVGLSDGSAWVSDCLTGQPDQLGSAVAERMCAAGAEEMLR